VAVASLMLHAMGDEAGSAELTDSSLAFLSTFTSTLTTIF
jgi:hypothetical protein